MKTLIQLTTVLFLLAQTLGYSQEQKTESTSIKQEPTLKVQNTKSDIDTEKFKSFIGTYLLVEGDFELEIVQEDNKLFIVSPFSKDLLIQKNDTTLREPSRGVDLERIEDDKNALRFTQNGYITIIKRVKSTTGK